MWTRSVFARHSDAISVVDVVRRAERSERTFWNHFKTWDDYTDALVSNIPMRGRVEEVDAYPAIQAVNAALLPSSRTALAGLARSAAHDIWSEMTRPEELTAFRRQLLLASRADGDNHLTEVLERDYYGQYIPRLRRIYEDTGAQTLTEPIAPFDFDDFARILAALTEGLLIQYIADPERTTTRLVTDATVAVALTLLTPQEKPGSIADIEASISTPPAPLKADPRMTTWVAASQEALQGREDPIDWAEASLLTGTPRVELMSSLQRLEVLGSLVFGELLSRADADSRDLRGSRGGNSRPAGADGVPNGPLLSITDWLCRLVRTARSHTWCARCLLQERLRPGEDAGVIHLMVPLGDAISGLLGEPTRSVHHRIVNATLAAALSDESAPPAEIAHCTVQLHPALRSAIHATSSL
ncbi:MAG: hypothetical protein M5U19_01585 [Microthrixaceae bacterium]|nr:hypothetical protein [Microthrixaceae bacterium]